MRAGAPRSARCGRDHGRPGREDRPADGSVVVLARLLSPHDYGLMAMVVVIVGVGEIFRDFGLSSAAVQAKELSVAQRDNLFWINTGIGATLGRSSPAAPS